MGEQITPNKTINLVDAKRYEVPTTDERFDLVAGQDTVAFKLPEPVPVGKIASVRVEVSISWRDDK